MTHDTNTVRQILVNELGLTRESVRGLAVDFIQATLQRQLEQPGYLKDLVESIVERELRKLLTKKPYVTEDPLTAMVRSAANDAAEQAVKGAVRIEVLPKATP